MSKDMMNNDVPVVGGGEVRYVSHEYLAEVLARATRTEKAEAALAQAVADERARCAGIAIAMAVNPWGAEHDGITPRHLAEQIAAAIRGPDTERRAP